MSRFAKWAQKEHPTGSRIAAMLLAGLVFLGLLPYVLLVICPSLDRLLGLQGFVIGMANAFAGGTLALLGYALAVWAVSVQLTEGRGTPLPVMPTQGLLTTGPFRYCRNPMTLGAVLAYLGLAIAAGTIVGVALVVCLTALLLLYLKRIEERELAERFGAAYRTYRQEVPFIIPKARTLWAGLSGWRQELLFAAPIVAFVAVLFYIWYGMLDRYFVFLYNHQMGSGFDTTPFGWVTAGRYWMSGLVAGGAVMVLYTAFVFVLGRVIRTYRPPAWWRLWITCAIPLAIAIPAIVMTVNDPVMPPAVAVQITVAALAALALAVMPGPIAARRPAAFALWMVDGFALASLLLSLIRVESYALWLARGSTGYIAMHLALVVAGIALLLGMTVVYRRWRRTEIPSAAASYIAGLEVAYLLLPLCHHLFGSGDAFVYISDAANFFARSVPLQIGVWLAVALIAVGITRLRTRTSPRGRPVRSGET